MQARRRHLSACPRLVVRICGSRSEDQMPTRFGVLEQPLKLLVGCHVKACHYEGGVLTRGRLRRIFRREQVLGVHDAYLQCGVEYAAIEGLENALVGAWIGR